MPRGREGPQRCRPPSCKLTLFAMSVVSQICRGQTAAVITLPFIMDSFCSRLRWHLQSSCRSLAPTTRHCTKPALMNAEPPNLRHRTVAFAMLQRSIPNFEHAEHAPLRPENQMLISSAGPAPVRNCSPALSHLHGANLHRSMGHGKGSCRGGVDGSWPRGSLMLGVPCEASSPVLAWASRSFRFSPRPSHLVEPFPHLRKHAREGSWICWSASPRFTSQTPTPRPSSASLGPPPASIPTAHPWPRSTGNRQMLRKGKIPGTSTQSTRIIGHVRAGPRFFWRRRWMDSHCLRLFQYIPLCPLFFTFQTRRSVSARDHFQAHVCT